MESMYPLLSRSLGRLHHAHRLPVRSLRAIPSTSYQRRAASGDINHTAAAMSSANETRVMDAIKHDHAELKDYYHKILDAKDSDTKARWQNQFTWELARHSTGEELVVYPAMERNMGDEGKQMADKDRSEHNKVKELLHKFQKLPPGDSEFQPTLESLWSELSKHIEEEETHDLPALEKTLSEGDSQSMSKSFKRTKMFVPTRSHPAAPDKPPYETVAGMLATPMDKLGDMFRRFPKE